ncbi:YolD-like family protein [Sutcliffiella deserti]|uniref:YolD-like family protein n=1 Tax=Sutcliffiella deserti TaxID=2875501 RepID=UPI001CC1C063|nr:YolD-like family protein [Sutcliffiella deserti]
MEYKKEDKLTNQSMYLWKNEQNLTVQGFLLYPENVPDIQYIKKLLRHIYLARETIKITIWFEGDVIQVTGHIQSFRYKANKITIKDSDKNIYHIRIFDVIEIIRKSHR